MGEQQQQDEQQEQEKTKDDMENNLDKETINLLGKNPAADAQKITSLHPDLAARCDEWSSTGIPREEREKLRDKYPIKANCRLEAPELNAEVQAALQENGYKRDMAIVNSQNKISLGVAAIGGAITELTTTKNNPIHIDGNSHRHCKNFSGLTSQRVNNAESTCKPQHGPRNTIGFGENENRQIFIWRKSGKEA